MSLAVETLSRRLLPWLEPTFAKLEAARAAGRLSHAWLISGPAGIGKLNLSFVLARRLFGGSLEPGALGADAAVSAMDRRYDPMDRHPDLHWLYPRERKAEDDDTEDESKPKEKGAKAAIGIDQVRDAIDALTLTAHRSGAKVLVIEPAEVLTREAANALLKTLEEPTRDTYLLLTSQQPGRVPPTVRSRCQHLKLHAPSVAALAEWLAVEPAVVLEAQRAVGTAPLSVAAAIRQEVMKKFSKLQADLRALSEDRIDPQAVAQSWAKGETKTEAKREVELVLSWLQRQIHEALRARLAKTAGSTEVTVPGAATLHNAWRALPERALFDEYDRAEKLLNHLGSGLNVELALTAMLNALVVNRGRS
jgi:DNA polymerase-3 subunit delta'